MSVKGSNRSHVLDNVVLRGCKISYRRGRARFLELDQWKLLPRERKRKGEEIFYPPTGMGLKVIARRLGRGDEDK